MAESVRTLDPTVAVVGSWESPAGPGRDTGTPARAGAFQVLIKLWNGATVALEVQPETTVAAVKGMVHQCRDAPS